MNKLTYEEGIKYLLEVEPRFKKIIPKHEIRFFQRPKGFAGIISLVIEQQVSVQAAEAIKNKVKALMVDLSADRIMELSTDKLRDVGLSRPKISYLKGIAMEERNGKLNYSDVENMADEDAREYLCQFKGVRRLKDLKKRPTVEDMTSIARKWRPFRSVAANIIWADYD